MRAVFAWVMCCVFLMGAVSPADAGPRGEAVLHRPGAIAEIAEGGVRALARVEQEGAALDLRLLVLGEGAPLSARVALADGQRHALVIRRGGLRLELAARRRGGSVHLRLEVVTGDVAALARR